MSSSRAHLPTILLLIIGALIYASAITVPFIFDDHVQIVDNPLVQSLQFLPKLMQGSTFFSGHFSKLDGVFYRPLMMISFNLIYNLLGPQSLNFHLVQISLHLATAVLLFSLGKRFLSTQLAWFAALIWMVHPINVEAVVYISNLQDVLKLFFGLVGLLLSHKPLTAQKRLLLALVWFLTLMSKESGLIYVFLSLLLIRSHQSTQFKPAVKTALLVFLTYGLLRFQAVGFPVSDPVVPIARAPLSHRLLTIPKVIVSYLLTFLLPLKLHTGQNWIVTQPTITDFYLPLLISISLFGLALKRISTPLKHQQFWPRLLLIWIVSNLLLHSQLIPLDATVADRWFYGTSAAFILLIAQGLQKMGSIQPKPLFASLCVITTLFTSLTLNRINQWQNPQQLMEHDYQFSAPSFNLANNLGMYAFQAGDVDTALTYFHASIDHVPIWGVSWTNLGVTWEAKAETDPTNQADYYPKASSAYQKAIKYHAGVTPYVNLARLWVYTQIESDDTITSFLISATNRYPDNPDLWFLLSQWELNQARFNTAIQAATRFHQLIQSTQSLEWLTQVEQTASDSATN